LQIVIDTNVFISTLRSRNGASYKLFTLLGSQKFEINISVPLILEYEDAAKRLLGEIALNEEDINAIINYICAVGKHRKIFYLWRPVLRDPKDEMLLELAVAGGCDYIVTYNTADFAEIEQFGVQAIKPSAFLREIGEAE